MSKDYYDILGVGKNASADEVKKAYYKLAHQHHPHKGGDEVKMKEINEAYAVLGNEQKRQQYDQFGSSFQGAAGQGGFSDFAQNFRTGGGQSFSFDFNDLGDIFGDFFGGGGKNKTRTSRRQGADIEVSIMLEFQEAVFGVTKTIEISKDASCQTCGGSGAEAGSKVVTCKTCNGTGQIVRSVGFGIGFPSVCPDCEGEGKKIEKPCSVCRGRGVTRQPEVLSVKIPAGIDNNQVIRLVGKGASGLKNAPAGDLYVKVRVTPDHRFERDGSTIRTKAEISFAQAALGGKINVDTLDGSVSLKIPDGTESGKVFSIKGKGVPYLESRGRGDHLVQVIVKTPIKLNRRQRELLEELQKLDEA